MKKILIVSIIIMALFLIYLNNVNKKNTVNSEENQLEENFEITREDILFEEGTFFAIENLSYDIDMSNEDVLFIELPGDEYYYIIPRYSNMNMKIYQNDFDEEITLIYESSSAEPFVIKGNSSDIFPNIEIKFTTETGEDIKFSPYISLKDGNLEFGDYGVEVINIF